MSPITAHAMNGRNRSYAVAAPSAKSVLSLASNNRCDVIVALRSPANAPIAKEQAVLEFLS